MQQSNIAEFVKLSRENDSQAFRKLVEAHQQMVFRLAFRMLCNEDDARDITQETFIKVWKNLHKYNTEMKFSTWLYAIATNICLDQLRKTKHKPYVQSNFENATELFISDENNEQTYINKQLSEVISGLSANLSSKQKIVFTLRDLEGLEIDEIIEITGLTASKIKSNLFLARQSIRKEMENL